MAAATENRNVTIKINGKEITNNIKSIEKEFHRLRNQVKKTQRGSQEYNDKMRELKRVKGILNDHNKQVRGMRGVWAGFGNMLRTQLAPLFAIGTLFNVLRGAVNTIREFGAAQANLAAVLGVTREEITQLEEDAKRLGASTKFTATEVSNLQTEYAKLGFSQTEILNITEATLQLAAATGEDLSEAAAVAGGTLRAFGLESSEMQRVVDVMAASFSSSALDLEKWKESMKTAAPLAKAAGVPIEETAAMLGKLADASISGSMAGTALKKIFNELSKDGRPLKDVLESVKTELDQASSPAEKLAIANDLVGERAQAALLVLADQNVEVGKLKEALDNAGGSAEKMANEQLNTLDGKLAILGSTWDGLILQFSESEGGMMKIVEVATAILNAYQIFIQEMQQSFADFDESLSALGDSFGWVSDESENTISVFDMVSTAVRFSMVPLQLLIKTLNSIVLGFRAVVEGGKVAWDFLSDFSLDEGTLGLQNSLDDFGNSLLDMGKTVIDPFVDLFSDDTELDKKLDERSEKIKKAMSGESDSSSPEDAAGRVVRTTMERIETIGPENVSEAEVAAQIELTKDQLMMEGLERRRGMHDEWLKEDKEKQIEQARQTREEWRQIFADSLDVGFQLADMAISQGTDREMEELEKRKEMGLLSDREYEKQREEIQKKAFRRKKALDISQAIINGALAITKATAQTGVLAPTVIPGIIASTAGQVALIAAQKFEDGGMFGLDGPSHAQGGMPVIDPRTGEVRAELEGGEMIIKKTSVNPRTAPVLRSINESGEVPNVNYSQASNNLRMEKGGMFGSSAMGDISKLVMAIERMEREKTVVLRLNDLEEETTRKEKVERLAGVVV